MEDGEEDCYYASCWKFGIFVGKRLYYHRERSSKIMEK